MAEDREDLLGQGRRGGKVEEKDDRSRQGKKAVSDRSTVVVWEWSRPWGGGPRGRTKLPGITELENRSHFHCDFGKQPQNMQAELQALSLMKQANISKCSSLPLKVRTPLLNR